MGSDTCAGWSGVDDLPDATVMGDSVALKGSGFGLVQFGRFRVLRIVSRLMP